MGVGVTSRDDSKATEEGEDDLHRITGVGDLEARSRFTILQLGSRLTRVVGGRYTNIGEWDIPG